MDLFSELLQVYLPYVLALVLALTVCLPAHELSHAYAADRLGDPTPRRDGRLTLNPLAHLDLWGTVCLLVAGFGWAKPVMINPFNLRDRRGGMALVALAGPIANLIMMLVMALLARLMLMTVYLVGSWVLILYNTFFYLSRINLALAVFNLIPVPPLDGSKVLYYFLPPRAAMKMQQNEHIISLVFLGFIILGSTGILAFGLGDILGLVISPIWNGVRLLFGI